MPDNRAEGPNKELWQLFHRCWTHAGTNYIKGEWLALEKEISSRLKAAAADERAACLKIAREECTANGIANLIELRSLSDGM